MSALIDSKAIKFIVSCSHHHHLHTLKCSLENHTCKKYILGKRCFLLIRAEGLKFLCQIISLRSYTCVVSTSHERVLETQDA